ncbi:MAG: hypothetical protein JWO38_3543 [Gemmataceae bacterium]|nr:hypothetical protein [Gemmataceae bacterium]
MSTEPQTSTPPPPAPPTSVAVYNVVRPGTKEEVDHIVVYGHSSLLYWWPVWLVSFVLAGVTYAEGDRSGGVTVSNTNGPGAVFVITLLAVAVSSTVIFRGMVSVVATVSVIAVTVAFAWFGWWGDILGFLGGLEIRINAAGYLCVGVPLFLAWLAVVGLYDRQHYVIFGRGQIRYVLEVGDSEVVMPAEGAIVEKKRSDAFRHWVLGLGAGDLVIRSGGHNTPTIELKNVLHIRRKMAVIDKLLREKAVTVD